MSHRAWLSPLQASCAWSSWVSTTTRSPRLGLRWTLALQLMHTVPISSTKMSTKLLGSTKSLVVLFATILMVLMGWLVNHRHSDKSFLLRRKRCLWTGLSIEVIQADPLANKDSFKRLRRQLGSMLASDGTCHSLNDMPRIFAWVNHLDWTSTFAPPTPSMAARSQYLDSAPYLFSPASGPYQSYIPYQPSQYIRYSNDLNSSAHNVQVHTSPPPHNYMSHSIPPNNFYHTARQ